MNVVQEKHNVRDRCLNSVQRPRSTLPANVCKISRRLSVELRQVYIIATGATNSAALGPIGSVESILPSAVLSSNASARTPAGPFAPWQDPPALTLSDNFVLCRDLGGCAPPVYCPMISYTLYHPESRQILRLFQEGSLRHSNNNSEELPRTVADSVDWM